MKLTFKQESERTKRIERKDEEKRSGRVWERRNSLIILGKEGLRAKKYLWGHFFESKFLDKTGIFDPNHN